MGDDAPRTRSSTCAWSTQRSTRTFPGWAPRSRSRRPGRPRRRTSTGQGGDGRDERAEVEGPVLDRPHRHVDEWWLHGPRSGGLHRPQRLHVCDVVHRHGLDRRRADVEIDRVEAPGVRRQWRARARAHILESRSPASVSSAAGTAPPNAWVTLGTPIAIPTSGELSSPCSWTQQVRPPLLRDRDQLGRHRRRQRRSEHPWEDEGRAFRRRHLLRRSQDARPGAARGPRRWAHTPSRESLHPRGREGRAVRSPRGRHGRRPGRHGPAGASGRRDRALSSRRTARAPGQHGPQVGGTTRPPPTPTESRAVLRSVSPASEPGAFLAGYQRRGGRCGQGRQRVRPTGIVRPRRAAACAPSDGWRTRGATRSTGS